MPAVRTRRLAVIAAATVLVALVAGPVHATYPGRNGRIAYGKWTEPEVAVVTARPDGSDRRVIADGAAYHESTWSPDGRWLVAVRGENSYNPKKLVIMRADGSRRRVVTSMPGELSSPSFSANGKRLIFTNWRDGFRKAAMYTIRRDGTGRRRIAGHLDGVASGAVQSPSGRHYAFSYKKPGEERPNIYVIRRGGTTPRQLTDSHAFDNQPDWSPDGRRLVFQRMSANFARVNVVRINRDGTRERQLTDTRHYAEDPAWSPDGRKILYQLHGDKDTIRVMRANGSRDRRAVRDTQLLDPSWQPLPG